jgi:beta-lactamase regulating signal transducer with metallopeptidase domain
MAQAGKDKNGKRVKKSKTVTTDKEILYVWIGLGIFGVVIVFVVFYIIAVKLVNKKSKENLEDSNETNS